MQLCIDAADDHPGLALALDGIPGPTVTWQTEQNHSRELLPNIDRLISEAGHQKSDLTAVFIDVGPGGYAALRVGVSIAKAIAHGLNIPIVGVGRLELDAWNAAAAADRDTRVVAVHRAGRGELAWAAYARTGNDWREETAPTIEKADAVPAHLQSGDMLTGDIDEPLAEAAASTGATIVSPPTHRVVALATVGHRRLATGAIDDAGSLVPMYLRAPAIGPQR
jgi:tRNA threonylcarbamoyladenosine biosynthesis protein TsaB